MLLFLSPLLLAYEFGAVMQSGGGEVLRARAILRVFFEQFGWAGAHLPAILVTVVLLLWQVLAKESWRVRPRLLMRLCAESVVTCVPLILLGLLIGGSMAWAVQSDSGGAAVLSETSGSAAPLLLAIGAGVYEEFVFRLLLMTTIHLIAVDVIGLSRRLGTVIAIAVSSLAFAWAHGSVGFDGRTLFFVLAGVYLGLVFHWRGVGVAAGAHALYDLAVLSVLD